MHGQKSTLLFFSIDLVGSTVFKRFANSEYWPRALVAFGQFAERQLTNYWLNEFPQSIGAGKLTNSSISQKLRQERRYRLFANGLKEVTSEAKKKIDPKNNHKSKSEVLDSISSPPTVWKRLGDEVIFVKRVTHPVDVVLSTLGFRAFLEDVPDFDPNKIGTENEESRQEGGDESDVFDLGPPMPLKGTAWIATIDNVDVGLPDDRKLWFRNIGYFVQTPELLSLPSDITRILQDEGASNQLVEKVETEIRSSLGFSFREYLGPEIDEGFRICSFAQIEHLVVSSHLATWLLAHHEYIADGIEFSIERGFYLKGIATDMEYPSIYLRTKRGPIKGLDPNEALKALQIEKAVADRDTLCEAVSFFVSLHKKNMGRPRLMMHDGSEYNILDEID